MRGDTVKKAVVLPVLAILFLAGCAEEAKPERSPAELLDPVAVQVDTVPVERGDIQSWYLSGEAETGVYTAPVIPYVETLYFENGGTLEELKVLQGDTVTEGQLLATLDGSDTRDQIASVESQISRMDTLGSYEDRMLLADIAIAQEKLAMLEEAGAGPEAREVQAADIRILEAKLEQTRALRALERSELERQRDGLQQGLSGLELTAPFSGQIVYVSHAVQVQHQSRLSAYETLVCLADHTRMRIETDYIPETVIDKAVRIYALIDGREYELVYAPYSSEEYLARVRSDTLNTRFTFAQTSQELKVGDMAAIMIVTDRREDVLTVPTNALYRDGMDYYVKKLVQGQPVRCDVTVGLMTDVKAEICSGLQEGDTVYVKE